MRKCSNCKDLKNYDEFHKNKKMPLGIVYVCKICTSKKNKKTENELQESYKKRNERIRVQGLRSKGRVFSTEHRKKLSETKIKNKTQEQLNLSQAKVVYRRYKKNGFTYDFKEFLKISQKNCFYCGIEPLGVSKSQFDKRCSFNSRQGFFLYNGIDRKNNNLGYTKENIVPCCDMCNKAKRNVEFNKFLDWLDRIKNY